MQRSGFQPSSPRLPNALAFDPVRKPKPPAVPSTPSEERSLGAILPKLPPHAASPRVANTRVASFALGGTDNSAASGWLPCLSGANRMPLPMRLQGVPPPDAKLGNYNACSRQLAAELTFLITNDLSANDGLSRFCTVVAQGVGAEAVAALPATSLGLEACLGEHNFESACKATLASAPPCVRLATAIPHEMRTAAEQRSSLNLGGSERTHPAAEAVGQVAIREPANVGGALIQSKLPPLHSALVTPIADPGSGSTVALFICCNAAAGRFALHDELFVENAAQTVGLLWLHHLQMLRLVPLPGVPLAPPDAAASKLRTHWTALVQSRKLHRELRAEGLHALVRVGGPSPTPSPLDALCRTCRRILVARGLELRHTLIAVSAPSKRARAELHEQLLHVGEQWAAGLLLELKGEAARLGGQSCTGKVAEVLEFAVQAMVELGAHFHANLPRGAASAPVQAPAHAGAPGVDLPHDNEKRNSVYARMNGELERRVVYPVVAIARPVLATLQRAYDTRANQVRKDIAAALLSEDPKIQQATADIVASDEPPLLGNFAKAWLADGDYAKELRERAVELAGHEAAEAAASALDALVTSQGAAFRGELSTMLQGARQLLLSKLEQQCQEVAAWVDVALTGRLSYRDKLMAAVREQFPFLLRHLLSGILKAGTAPPEVRFAARHAAASAAPSSVSLPDPPPHAMQALTGTVGTAVDEFIKVVVRAVDPLSKQYPAVVSEIRPRIIKLRLPLRDALTSLFAVCVVHPDHVLPACTAVRRAADAIESALVPLEPKLLPLAEQPKSLQPPPPGELAVIIRKASKQAMLSEMPQLASTLAVVLATHGHLTARMENIIQPLLNGWSERCYVALVQAFTDFCGPAAAEAAAPLIAKLLPCAAQRLARDLHREVRLSHADRLAELGQRTHSLESDVARAMARPYCAGHVTAVAHTVVEALGTQLAAEIDRIVAEVAAAKYAEEAPKPKEPPARQRRKSLSDVASQDDDEHLSAVAAAKDIAASYGELQRETLRNLLAQVFARPAIRVLERSLLRALELGDWQWPESMTPQIHGCVSAWLEAMHARIGRSFLSSVTSPEEGRMLSYAQTVLSLSQKMLKPSGSKRVGGEELHDTDDGLLTTAERSGPALRNELSSIAGSLTPSPALCLLLHLDSGSYHPPAVHFGNQHLLNETPASAHAWALHRSRQLCLVDEVLAELDAAAATKPEDGLADELAALKIEGDPGAAEPAQPAPDSEVAESAAAVAITPQPTETHPPASQSVLTHLTRTMWTLVDTEWALPSLMRTLAAALPKAFDRPIRASLYVTMRAAPPEHQRSVQGVAGGDVEQVLYISIAGGSVQEERVVRLFSVPRGVRLAFVDGSRVEEVLEELAAPVWFGGNGADVLPAPKAPGDGGVDGTVSSHVLYIPVRCSSMPRPIAVAEVACQDGAQLQPAEREVATRLVSAFGGVATRIRKEDETRTANAQARAALTEEQTLRRKEEQECDRLRTLLKASSALLPVAQEPRTASSGLEALATAFRRVTGASKVTIFSVPTPAPPPASARAPVPGAAPASATGPEVPALAADAPLQVILNDFAAGAPPKNARRGSVRRSSVAPPPVTLADLPQQSIAKAVAKQKQLLNVSDPSRLPPDIFDGSVDAAAGFTSTCVLALPVVHSGEVLGVVQLTNKADGSDRPAGRASGIPSAELSPESAEDLESTATILFGQSYFDEGTAGEKSGEGASARAPAALSPPPTPPGFTPEEESAARRLLGVAALLLLPARSDGLAAAAAMQSAKEAAEASSLAPSAARPSARKAPGTPRDATDRAKDSAHGNGPTLVALPNSGPPIQLITAIMSEMGSSASLRMLLSAALKAASRLVPAQKVSIYVAGIEDDGSMVRAAQPHDELGKAILSELEVTRIGDAKHGIVGRVLSSNTLAMVQDVRNDPDFDKAVDSAPGYVVSSLLCAPVSGSTPGRVLAAVLICNKGKMDDEPPEFNQLDADALTLLATLLGPCLERQLLREGFEM